MAPLSSPLQFPFRGPLTAQPGIASAPLPSRSGILHGGVGRPTATVSNSFGIVAGASAHAAIGERAVDLSTYLEATASGQFARFDLSDLIDRIPELARVLFVRVRLWARSVGAGAATLRVAPLTALSSNTVVTRDLSIATGAPAEYELLFHAQEALSGEYAPWDGEALDDIVLRLESVHASNHVRVFHVEVLAFHLPVATVADFFDDPLADLGWLSEGNLGAGTAKGVARLLDTSNSFHRYSKPFPAVMAGLGDAVAQFEVPAAWTAFDGVYAFNCLTVERVDRHFAVNALFHGGSRKLGLLLGRPSLNDPTAIGSYAATVVFDWQDVVTLLLAWDGDQVRVFVNDDPEPVIEVAETAIGAGSSSNPWSGPYVSFATGWQPDGTPSPSKGEVLFLSCLFRGRQEPAADGVTLDYQQRREMSTADGFEATRLLWHAGVAFDRHKIRFGGGAHDDGFFISSANGSTNTEGTASVDAHEVVESLVAIRDLLPNDSAPDGDRVLRIYVRNAATQQWTPLLDGALEVPIKVFRRPPQVSAADFIAGSAAISLSADREFRVEPEDEAVPAGSEQAADLTFGEGEGLAVSAEPPFEPHQDSFPGRPTTIPLAPPSEVPLETEGTARLKFWVYDAYGLAELQLINLAILETTPFEGECDAGLRRAFPPITLEKGDQLEPWLRIWDRIACRWQHIAESMRDLIDPRTAPSHALPYKFQEAGLTYPNVPGYPQAALVRLLLRAREINGRRYSVPGLVFYLTTLIPGVVDVEVEGFRGGLFMFCDAPDLGLPTAAMISSAGSTTDTCTYLAGPLQEQTIFVTITGSVSPPLQEFLRATIRDELLMADDPVAPREIELVFVEP
jgi:hypothetical protein